MPRTNGRAAISKPRRGPGRPRGVSRSEYLILQRLVKADKTTWERLEAEGICLPVARKSEYRRQVEERLKQ